MRSPRLYVLTTLALLLSYSVLVFAKTYRPKPRSDEYVPIINKTSGFQVLQATRSGDRVTLSLKNNYHLSITTFVLKFGKSLQITEDFIASEVSDEVGIQPQEIFEHTYTLSLDRTNGSNRTSTTNPTITLQAVVLADKSGDGDVISLEEIRDNRLGQAVQVKRALRVLEKYINNMLDVEELETEMRAALDRLDHETLKAVKDIRPVGTMNRKSSDPLSDSVKEGMAVARSDVLRRLGEATESSRRKDVLLETKVYLEKLLNRL